MSPSRTADGAVRVPLSKIALVVPNPSVVAALSDGRAIVRGWATNKGGTTYSFGVAGEDGARSFHRQTSDGLDNPQAATDGTRIAVVTRDELALWDDPRSRPRTLAIRGRTKDNYVLSACLVPGESALWMVMSDAFWAVAGRYAALVTWNDAGARYARLQQPFPYRPYAHSGMFAVAIGAASSRHAWVYGDGQAKWGLLRTVGARSHPAVKVPKGAALFDPVARALTITPPKRKPIVVDASGEPRGRVDVPAGSQLVALCGRDRWMAGARGLARVSATDDLPSLDSAGARVTAPQEAVVREEVVGWDLNEPADLEHPGPVVELVLQDETLVFRKRTSGGTRFFFDFLLRAIRAVTWKPASAGRVLMEIVTPSGKTRALCTEAFARSLLDAVAERRA